jgi:hypothetical protein
MAMIQIAVSIGDVCTDVLTDQVLSFDAIESILNRATQSTLQAYNAYVVLDNEYEAIAEDDN